jgi:hypothetical protein
VLALTLAAAISTQPAQNTSVEAALQLCRPKIAKRISGEISAVAVQASSTPPGWIIIRGSARALLGMGQAGSVYARTHHLIRTDYEFICWVADTHVRKISVKRID